MRAVRVIRAVRAVRAIRAVRACDMCDTCGTYDACSTCDTRGTCGATSVMRWIMAVLLVSFGVWNAGVRARVEPRRVRDPAQEWCSYFELVFWYLRVSCAADF